MGLLDSGLFQPLIFKHCGAASSRGALTAEWVHKSLTEGFSVLGELLSTDPHVRFPDVEIQYLGNS